MKQRGIAAVVLLGATATAGWLGLRNLDLSAAEERPRSYRESYSNTQSRVAPTPVAEGVRLNFFDASWASVLESVARQQDLTLVMEQVPPGRYSRRDRSEYRPDDAIRILNTELEPQGYRLLRQRQYLIVLNLDQARTEYARPRLDQKFQSGSAPHLDSERAAALKDNVARRTYFDDGRPRNAVRTASNESRPLFRPGEEGFQQNGTVRPPISAVSSTRVAAPRQLPVEDAGPIETRTVGCQHTKAADTARSIYLVFQKRAELEQSGLNGLPTFTVFDQEDVAKRRQVFRIGIDQYNNELILEAPEARLQHLSRLISELDQPMEFGEEAVRLMPNNGLNAKTAEELNSQLQRLVAMQRRENQLTSAQQGPTADAGTAPAGDEAADGTLNLRGDVNLQALQDLGILILQGNQADVDKVAEIIERLENMSVGTVPNIEILSLSNINSEALAELLTSVYEELQELRERIGQQDRKAAAFVPVVQPNAVLVIASPNEMESIRTLADELDVPLDPEFEFRVFPLKNAIASQVVANLETFYEDRGGLGVRVRVVADVRTNSLVIHGRPTELTEVEQLIEKIDRDDSGAVHRVQIFELKNATAEELANTINLAIQAVINPPQQTQTGQLGGGFGANAQGAQELRESKSVALEFLTTDGNARELIRSGIMVDVRVNADVRTNTLIVSAPEASMPLMSALIETLDRAPSAIADVTIFTLQNADAEQSVTLLESLFENQNQEDELGIQIAGAEDAASSLIPLQFSADIRTNSVLAVGSVEALSVVEAILVRLDTDDTRQRQTTVIPLNNAPAELVADALTRFLEQQAALQDSTEDLISNIERLRQEVLVAEDTNSNSLIVSASPSYFSQITEIVETLDATPPEVIVQALLVEVGLDSTDEFGIELGFQDPLLFSRSLLTATADTAPSPGLNFNNTNVGLANPLVGAGASSNLVAAQALSNFSLGRQNADLGFGGFVFSAQSDAVSVLLRALAARRNIQILSRPQIRTTHNNLALVRLGQQVPIVVGANFTQLGAVQPIIEQQPVGIILQVTPRIRNDGVIAMEVYAEKSALSDNSVPIAFDNNGNAIESPIIDQAIADTTVNVPNGQTIVIGGMITKNDSSFQTKVPWLGDLPVIGAAFRYDSNRIRRSELLIFLTPRVILGDVDSELIKQVETERLHFIESDAEEVHGPLYSVPPVGSQYQNDPYFAPGVDPQAPAGVNYMSDELNLDPVAPPTPSTLEPQLNFDQKRGSQGDADWQIEPVSRESSKPETVTKRASWWRR